MSERRLYLDEGIGQTRGVVTLDGRPERLLLSRDGDLAAQALGARSIGRATRIAKPQALAFVDLPEGPPCVINLRPEHAWLAEGAAAEVEIRGEARAGKGAAARLIGPAEGAPRLLSPAPALEERLQAFAPKAAIVRGGAARATADQAEDEALAEIHPLPGGGSLAIERTRALTAIDVDFGERHGGDAKRAVRATNLTAVAAAARLLRLKGLGGLIVIDLIGDGRDGPTLIGAARAAFAPDNPGVVLGPMSRFGTLELAVPRRQRPVMEILGAGDAEAALRTEALVLVRALEREAQADGGGRFAALASPAVAALAEPLVARLAERLGARVAVRADAARATGFAVGPA